MDDQFDQSKLDTDIFSHSRAASVSSTTRVMYHVGEPAQYLEPKQPPENSSEALASSTESSLSVSEKSFRCLDSAKSLKVHQNMKDYENKIITPNIVFIRHSHWIIHIFEIMIYLTYLYGSFPDLPVSWIIDLVGSIICVIKIVTVHSWIFIHNSKNETENPESNINYINKLQLHELIQILALLLTLLCLFPFNSLLNSIFISMKLIRLFFPFLYDRKASNKWRANVSGHIIKITSMILVFTVMLTVFMKLLLYGLDSSYCLSIDELERLTIGVNNMVLGDSCGVNAGCSTGECRNLFSFASNPEHFDILSQYFALQNSFSHNFLQNFILTMGLSSTFFEKYRTLTIEWILLPLMSILWLTFLIMKGFGIGEVISYESVENFKRNEQSKEKEQRQSKRVSNIGFIPISIENDGGESEFTIEIEAIAKGYTMRRWPLKAATHIFNLFSLCQVILAILFDLELQVSTNQAVGICLGVMFIMWSLGVVFSLYQYFSNEELRSSQIKTNILIFECICFSLCLLDYVVRICKGYLIFEKGTEVTPIAHAAISLRIIYILYNNGIDPYISYYTQKMIENLKVNLFILGVVATIGLLIGFLQIYFLNIKSIEGQIQSVSNGVRAIYGSGRIQIYNGIVGDLLELAIKIMSIVATFYIAKNINIGYDSILEIDFGDGENLYLSSNEPETTHEESNNKLRTFANQITSNTYYIKFKIALILVYLGVSLASQSYNEVISIIQLCFDIFLMLDLCLLIISQSFSFFQNDIIVKIVYMATQLFLILSFFIETHTAVTNSLHVSRALLLFTLVPDLNSTYSLIKSILFNSKLKTYKIVIVSIITILIALVLSAPLIPKESPHQILHLFGSAIGFVFWGGWEVPDNRNSFGKALALNFVQICVITLLHIILTFMMVTYFVNRKVYGMGNYAQQIIQEYSSSSAESYSYSRTTHKAYNFYTQILKIIIIFASLVLTVILSGNILQISNHRIGFSVLNLSLVFVEVCIYILENLFLKLDSWPIGEGLLIGLSLPGCFFLIVPVDKFGVGQEINIIVHFAMALSILRFFRIFGIITNRNLGNLSSKVLRRLAKELELGEITGLFCFLILGTLVFSTFWSSYAESEPSTSFISLLTTTWKPTESVAVLVTQFLYLVCIDFPLKTMLIARVISSFLHNKPNQLYILRDEIKQVITDSCVVDEKENELVLNYLDFYRFCARIEKLFIQFCQKKPIKCDKYEITMKKIKKLKIPVYCLEEEIDEIEKSTRYVILAYDIIWNVFLTTLSKKEQLKNSLKSLYEVKSPRNCQITKTHIDTYKLFSYLPMRERIRKLIPGKNHENLMKSQKQF